MRLSKRIIEKMVADATISLKMDFDSKHGKFNTVCLSMILDNIPVAVLNVYNTHPQFFHLQTSGPVYNSLHNRLFDGLFIQGPFPTDWDTVKLTDAQIIRLNPYYEARIRAKVEWIKAVEALTKALVSLKTSKAVYEALPFMERLLPDYAKSEPVIVDAAKLRKLLKL